MFVGIDPWKNGAIAKLNGNAEPLDVVYMPCVTIGTRVFADGYAISEYLDGSEHICIELVSSRPGQGAPSTFTFGQGFDGVVTLATAFVDDLILEVPQTWQRHYGFKKKRESKAADRRQVP